MRYLKQRGLQGVTLIDYLMSPSRHKVAITFDDGYADLMDYAWPLLTSLDYHATVFIPTDFIGKWNTWDANLDGKRSRHLDENQLRRLSDSQWEIASHSTNHRSLFIMNASEQDHAMSTSYEHLRRILTTPISGFSYPFGHVNTSIREKASRYYTYAAGVISLDGSNPHSLSRIPITGWDVIPIFKLKTSPIPAIRFLLQIPVWISSLFTFGTVLLQFFRKISIFKSNPSNTI